MQQARNVFLTGAAGGIGAAIATSLIAEGHTVILCDRDQGKVEALADELGVRAFPLVLDIPDASAVQCVKDRLPAAIGPIDTLINNAGHHNGGGVPFADGDVGDWSSVVETNVTGLIRVTHALLPSMIELNRGDIVNISSINAIRVLPNTAPYSASKAAVHMLTDTLRAELTGTDIKVTEINPGLTKTGIQARRYKGDAAKAQAYYDKFRWTLLPEDIARSVMFALNQPLHVQIAQMVVLPTDRA